MGEPILDLQPSVAAKLHTFLLLFFYFFNIVEMLGSIGGVHG